LHPREARGHRARRDRIAARPHAARAAGAAMSSRTDERSRRGSALQSAVLAQPECYSALASRDVTRDELLELVLQFSIHAGWPKGAVLQGVILEQADRVAKGLPFEP